VTGWAPGSLAATGITHVGERALLTLVCLVALGLALAGMRLGWVRRARRDGDLLAPRPLPDSLGGPLLAALPVTYLGTTTAGNMLDRVTAHGLGQPRTGEVSVHPQGLVLARDGAEPVLLATEVLAGVRTDRGLVTRVAEPDSTVVVTWRAGRALLDTGVRPRAR